MVDRSHPSSPYRGDGRSPGGLCVRAVRCRTRRVLGGALYRARGRDQWRRSCGCKTTTRTRSIFGPCGAPSFAGGWLSPRYRSFASDGPSPRRDLLTQDSTPAIERTLFRFRPEWRFFARRRLVNTTLDDVALAPATAAALAPYFRTRSASVAPDTTTLIFVTDHGRRNEEAPDGRNHFISLWGEQLSVRGFHRLLEPVRHRVVSVMSQCYSGSFAWSNYPDPKQLTTPRGDRCGFYSVPPDRPSYGCLPSWRPQDRAGHAFAFADAIGWARTIDEAHQAVLLIDRTPDVPVRSSDLYLQAILQKQAEMADRAPAALAQDLLQRDASRVRQEDAGHDMIARIARRFRLPAPDGLKAVIAHKRALKQRRKKWRQVRSRWITAYNLLRNDQLDPWLELNTELQHKLSVKYSAWDAAEDGVTMAHRDSDFRQMVDSFAQALARKPAVLSRLQRFEQKIDEVEAYIDWIDVQRAALQRIEILYLRRAAQILFEDQTDARMADLRAGLGRLEACEQTSLGRVGPTLGTRPAEWRETPDRAFNARTPPVARRPLPSLCSRRNTASQ